MNLQYNDKRWKSIPSRKSKQNSYINNKKNETIIKSFKS